MQACYDKNMKRADSKSHCPINFSLETFGDPWSLLIVRDIVYFGKKTYGEFLDSEERIATNILATRLAELEKHGILSKQPHPTDKRKEVYALTERGLDTIPLLFDMASWGCRNDPQTTAPEAWINLTDTKRAEMIALVRETVRNGDAVFVGPNSVVSKCGF